MPVLEKRLALKNIVYATDFSQASEPALQYTLALARKFGAVVTAVHVISRETYAAWTPELGDIVGELEASAVQSMRGVEEKLGSIHHNVMIRHGDICDEVAHFSAIQAADLVVVGTADRTGMQHVLSGSVAEEIVRTCSCPVLTVGLNATGRQLPAEMRFSRILYCTDLTEEPSRAAALACALTEEDQATLTLLNVASLTTEQFADRQPTVAGLHKKLRALLPDQADAGRRPETIVEFGDAAQRIAAVASEMDVDLLVLAARHSRFPGLAAHADSVIHRVLTGVHCPVLTVCAST